MSGRFGAFLEEKQKPEKKGGYYHHQQKHAIHKDSVYDKNKSFFSSHVVANVVFMLWGTERMIFKNNINLSAQLRHWRSVLNSY